MKDATPNIEVILKKLKIEDNEILKENPIIKDKLIQLVSEYADVFSDPEGTIIGTTEYRIVGIRCSAKGGCETCAAEVETCAAEVETFEPEAKRQFAETVGSMDQRRCG